jgi:hypothetical protein
MVHNAGSHREGAHCAEGRVDEFFLSSGVSKEIEGLSVDANPTVATAASLRSESVSQNAAARFGKQTSASNFSGCGIEGCYPDNPWLCSALTQRSKMASAQ